MVELPCLDLVYWSYLKTNLVFRFFDEAGTVSDITKVLTGLLLYINLVSTFLKTSVQECIFHTNESFYAAIDELSDFFFLD